MKVKEYEMPDGRKAAFEYDESGVGKITLECMDMLMGLINDRKTEPLPKIINGVKIADAVAWADKWLEDNPVSEMWDMVRTLRDATEWQDEPQTECNPTCKFYDERCLNVECYDCRDGYSRYEPKDEPQTDCAWK